MKKLIALALALLLAGQALAEAPMRLLNVTGTMHSGGRTGRFPMRMCGMQPILMP